MLQIRCQRQEYLFLGHEFQIQILQDQAQKSAADLLQLVFEYPFLKEIAPLLFQEVVPFIRKIRNTAYQLQVI
jgi:hypothetical protein